MTTAIIAHIGEATVCTNALSEVHGKAAAIHHHQWAARQHLHHTHQTTCYGDIEVKTKRYDHLNAAIPYCWKGMMEVLASCRPVVVYSCRLSNVLWPISSHLSVGASFC